jgi:hypothetical protein
MTSVSGDQKMFSAEEAADLDTEFDSWAEVMAAAEMAANTASRDARAGAVKSENPLFEPVDTEEEVTKEVTVEGLAAEVIQEEAAAVKEANPIFHWVEEGAEAEEAAIEEAATTTTTATTTTIATATTTQTAIATMAGVAVAVTTTTAAAAAELEEVAEQLSEEGRGATTAETQDVPDEESSFGGGASSSQIQSQSRVFDPGILKFLAYFQI